MLFFINIVYCFIVLKNLKDIVFFEINLNCIKIVLLYKFKGINCVFVFVFYRIFIGWVNYCLVINFLIEDMIVRFIVYKNLRGKWNYYWNVIINNKLFKEI